MVNEMEGTTYKLQQEILTSNGHKHYLDIGSAYNKSQLVELKKMAVKYRIETPDIVLRLLERSTKIVSV